jgi:mono/diheme cytochrome c family protein
MYHLQISHSSARAMRTILVAGFFSGSLSMLHAEVKPAIRHVPPEYTKVSDGSQMFKTYCAVCHGTTGKGDGVAIPALRKMPSDLTLLSRQNGGKYPEFRVVNAIEGDADVIAHGTKEMPVWGSVFRRMQAAQGVARLRLYSLTRYIESIQVK